LQTIARDQAANDIHPPLYFWLLHGWTRLWGVEPSTGPLLNIILFLVGAPALYGLARYLLQNEQEALLVTLIWAVSPAVLQTAGEARQYDLFGVITIVFIWLLALCLDTKHPTRLWHWLLLGIAAAAGSLTHFHFILVATGGLLIFGRRQLQQNNRVRPSRQLLTAVSVIAAGYIFSLLLHPAFLTSFETLADRQVDEATFFLTPLDVMRRLFAAVETFTGYWVYGWPLQVALFIVFLSAIAFLGLALIRNRQGLADGIKRMDWTGYQGLLIYLWLGGISILMYLTFISPIHAMTARHMSAVWPFYAFLAVFLIRFIRVTWQRSQLAHNIMVGLAIIMIIFGGLSIRQVNGKMRSRIEGVDNLEAAPVILVDTVHRGILPQLLIHVPSHKQIYADWQRSLIERPEDWLAQLPDGTLYLSEGAYGNSAEGHQEILSILDEGFMLHPVDGSIPGINAAYLLEKRNQ
jgi:uncharacterized membrane protein